ncbi:methionyl-tRNA formyltransferase [[Clostridium] fimetarium]|uniref:Methionyl-tRNA formyltransferase n=1 Tax=[Clostridium] fimetarium TaxID=99656 RepID=A0A1I0MSM8_9FIRM|nr:methionyl-tRNA formyltransferase [[Clostridium] fimetarium]SEV91432.1 methionyl-tRNA formyltransferase [[Clostridium] fimetarium]
MRVVFMGTPDFAAGTLVKIVESGHEVVGVFTQPDKPKGRGKEMSMSPVKQKALELNLSVFQPEKIRKPEVIEDIRQLKPEVIVVVAFGQILTKELLEIPKFGSINVHASLLPAYRGAAPIQWAVIDGLKKTGVTTMAMDAGIDTGDILMQRELTLHKKETGGSLFDRLSVIGAELLVETLTALENGTAIRTKQEDELSNYAKRLDKALGEIDFNNSAENIERLIRGLNPWPSAFTHIDGKTLKIWDADIVDEEYAGLAGTIVDINKQNFIVKCGERALQINEVQLEGKKRMTTDAFLRGNELGNGTILG